MDITPYVEEMITGLRIALAAQTEPQQAEHLAAAVQAPARLALMGAISQAAAEASNTLPTGRIGVQLAGANLVLAYEPGPSAPAETAPTLSSADVSDGDDDGQARLTLRLPASVKARAERAAADKGVSLNTWVVGALRDATDVDRLDMQFGPVGVRLRPGSQRMQGWV